MKCRRDFLCYSPSTVWLPNVKHLGNKTEYSYVTRNDTASFPFRILKPETSFNIFMPSDSMTVCSQKVNSSLRSKAHLTQETGCLSGEAKGDGELLLVFFLS